MNIKEYRIGNRRIYRKMGFLDLMFYKHYELMLIMIGMFFNTAILLAVLISE